MTRFLLTLVLAVLSPNLAVAQTPPAPPAPVINDDAQRLGMLVLPKELLLAVRVPRFEANYAEALATDEKLAALEVKYPGIKQAVAKEEATIAYAKACFALQADAAELYRKNLTPDEVRKAIDFLSTETGQLLVSLNADASGETASAMEADRRAKVIARLQNPSEQMKADLTQFMKSGLLPKTRALTPQVSALATARFNDVTKLIEASLKPRIDKVIADYVAGKR